MAAIPLGEAIGLDNRDVVALVGGGGKTSALRRLGAECAARGERVVLASTTKIEAQRDLRTVFVTGPAELPGPGSDGPWPVLVVTEDLGNRLRGVPPEWLDGWAASALRLLVQADGAGRRPFKAPAAHEPVIPRSATLVVSVVGIDALGVPLSDAHVNRAARVAEIAGLPLGAAVSEDAIARVLLDPEAGGKGVPQGARRVALINKVESDGELRAARRIAARLREGGLHSVIASLRQDRIECC